MQAMTQAERFHSTLADSRRQALPHSRLAMLERSDGLYCHLCLAQQRQPTRHITTSLMRTGHLRDQVGTLTV